LTIAFVVSLTGVSAYAKKAGEVKDDIYFDSKFDISFKLPEGWSNKVKRDKSVLRLTVTQTSPVPPRHFQGNKQDYMQIPSINLFVDTTSLTVDEFVEGLQDSESKSKQFKYLRGKIKIISRPFEVFSQKSITFRGQKTSIMTFRQAYMMEVATGGSDRADVINDYKSGSLFCTVRDGHVFIIDMVCEYQTSKPLFDVFNALVETISFGDRNVEDAEDEEELENIEDL
jgi:hypothetical protein